MLRPSVEAEEADDGAEAVSPADGPSTSDLQTSVKENEEKPARSKRKKKPLNAQSPNTFENPDHDPEVLKQIRAEQMKGRRSWFDLRTQLERDAADFWRKAKRVKAADLMPETNTRFLPSFVHEVKASNNGHLTPKQLVERRLNAAKRTRRGELPESTFVVEYPNGVRAVTPLSRELAAKFGHPWVENEEVVRNGVGLRLGVRNLGPAAVDAFRELAGEPPDDEVESLPDEGPIYINADESADEENEADHPGKNSTSKRPCRRSSRRLGKDQKAEVVAELSTCGDRGSTKEEAEGNSPKSNGNIKDARSPHSNDLESWLPLCRPPSCSTGSVKPVDPKAERRWSSVCPLQMAKHPVERVNPAVMPTTVAHPYDSRVTILTTLPLNTQEHNLRPPALSAPPRRLTHNPSSFDSIGSDLMSIVDLNGLAGKPKSRRYSNIAVPRPGHLNATTDPEWRHHETPSAMEHLPPPFAPRRPFAHSNSTGGESWRGDQLEGSSSFSWNQARVFARHFDTELTNRLTQWRHGPGRGSRNKFVDADGEWQLSTRKHHSFDLSSRSLFNSQHLELKPQTPFAAHLNGADCWSQEQQAEQPANAQQIEIVTSAAYKRQLESRRMAQSERLMTSERPTEQLDGGLPHAQKPPAFTPINSVVDFDPFGELPGDEKHRKRRGKRRTGNKGVQMESAEQQVYSSDVRFTSMPPTAPQDLTFTPLQLASAAVDLPEASDYKGRPLSSTNSTYVPPALRQSASKKYVPPQARVPVGPRNNSTSQWPPLISPGGHDHSSGSQPSSSRKRRPTHPFTTILRGRQVGTPPVDCRRPHSAPPVHHPYQVVDKYAEFAQTFDVRRPDSLVSNWRAKKLDKKKDIRVNFDLDSDHCSSESSAEEELEAPKKQHLPDTYFPHLDEAMNVPRVRDLFDHPLVHPLCHLYRHPAVLPKNSIFWSGDDPNFVWTQEEFDEAIKLLVDQLGLGVSPTSDQLTQIGRLITLERAMRMLKNAAKSLDLTPRIAPQVKQYSRDFSLALRQFYELAEQQDEEDDIWYKLPTAWDRKTENSFLEYLTDGLDAMEYVQRINNQGCCVDECDTELLASTCTALDRYNHFMYNPGFDSYSRKVFVGGVPSDVDEDEFLHTFRQFGKLTADWPSRTEAPTRSQQTTYYTSSNKSRSGEYSLAEGLLLMYSQGYVFLIYAEERSVHVLQQSCVVEDGQYFMPISGTEDPKRMVQVRPWLLSEADFLVDPFMRINLRFAVFIGGVPRPIRASELAHTMNVLYGHVVMAGIDTDLPLKYPKGAGRVVFSDFHSYMRAISDRFVRLHHGDIDKIVEIKPYVLDDQRCDECHGRLTDQPVAPFFCPSPDCLQYYCENCWGVLHANGRRSKHRPLVKEA